LLLHLLLLLAGQEPEYTSSHSQFMGCCDYIWFTNTPLTQHTTTQQQQQQQQQQPASQLQQQQRQVPGDRTNTASSSSSSSSGSRPQQAGRYELRPVAVLQPPDGLRLPKGLPTKHLGSDHICLLTDFELLYRQDRV
jgi:mRNA deadenylase 3'-5' endonuclease subunit Ccr4